MTVSTTASIASGLKQTTATMRARNAIYEVPVKNFLTELLAQPKDHAKLLHLLAMMEHIGSRKIMMSGNMGAFDQEKLKHLAEETRHAFFFKKQAERLFGQMGMTFTSDNTMAYHAGKNYFARLDAHISKKAGRDKAYALVSLIVEYRAVWFYEIYQETLRRDKNPMSLQSLLAEEDLHLGEMYALAGVPDDMIDDLSAFETSLFDRLWRSVAPSSHRATPLAA
jgi:hypothetical protein